MAVANDIESANRQVGQELTVKRPQRAFGPDGDRDFSASEVEITAYFTPPTLEHGQGNPVPIEASLRTSAVSGYEPAIGDRIIIDGADYTIHTFTSRRLSGVITEYEIKARA